MGPVGVRRLPYAADGRSAWYGVQIRVQALLSSTRQTTDEGARRGDGHRSWTAQFLTASKEREALRQSRDARFVAPCGGSRDVRININITTVHSTKKNRHRVPAVRSPRLWVCCYCTKWQFHSSYSGLLNLASILPDRFVKCIWRNRSCCLCPQLVP